MPIHFSKYQSLGNDFVIIDRVVAGPGVEVLVAGGAGPATARRLCDRHFGVGADGILWLDPSPDAGAARRLTIWNADGSQAEMCGNGVRCVAKYLHDRAPAADRPGVVVIASAAGPRLCRITAGPDGLAAEIEVEMGRAEVSALDERVVLPSQAAPAVLTRVSMGNPHAVLFREDASAEVIRRFGPELTQHPNFPGGTNVEVVRREADGSLTMHVWERGAGPTLACGTGACATAAAACAHGLAAYDRPVQVHLPGGTLEVTVAADGQARLRGVAVHVFDGVL